MGRKKIIPFIFLILGLSLEGIVFAQERPALTDKIIGATFKSLAKAFVAVVDINQLKKDNIAKLKKMDEEKFKKNYAKVYAVIKDLPSQLKSTYKIREDMSKQQATRNIESLNKKKIDQIIDAIPDTIIADNFRQYLNKTKEDIQKSNLVVQVNKLWNRIIEKIEKK